MAAMYEPQSAISMNRLKCRILAPFADSRDPPKRPEKKFSPEGTSDAAKSQPCNDLGRRKTFFVRNGICQRGGLIIEATLSDATVLGELELWFWVVGRLWLGDDRGHAPEVRRGAAEAVRVPGS